jgi:predicted transcriptional regulator
MIGGQCPPYIRYISYINLGKRLRIFIIMKQLKSSLQDLREIFERSITIMHIAEPLCSFDINSSANEVKKFMDDKDYDVIGVRENGLISGFARKSQFSGGQLRDYLTKFDEKNLLHGTDSIINLIESFRYTDTIFVLFFGKVGGIITRGDLQKIIIRMWLFGLISLIEMHLLRIIRKFFPDGQWEKFLNKKRIDDARKILSARRRKNLAIDLVDCLQLCDKREIIINYKEILNKLSINRNSCEKFLKRLEPLRNDLAHAQDIITENWPEIIHIVKDAEDFLDKCEEI